jgi:hypothetical protein
MYTLYNGRGWLFTKVLRVYFEKTVAWNKLLMYVSNMIYVAVSI